MDASLRDLERRCAEAPLDPGTWLALARVRLRSGLRPALALAAVRSGLRASPADLELRRVRDEALLAFHRDPAWRILHERAGAYGTRLAFSADGSLLAVAGRGFVVYRVDENELAGGGFAGIRDLRVAFAGDDVLVGTPTDLARVSLADGRVKKRPREWRTPVLALGVDAAARRAVVVSTDRVLLLALPALQIGGARGHEPTTSAFVHVEEGRPDLVLTTERLGLGEGMAALSPDRARVHVGARGATVVTHAFDASRAATAPLVPDDARVAAMACSPCGSRLVYCRTPDSRGGPPLVVLEAV